MDEGAQTYEQRYRENRIKSLTATAKELLALMSQIQFPTWVMRSALFNRAFAGERRAVEKRRADGSCRELDLGHQGQSGVVFRRVDPDLRPAAGL